MSNFNGKFVKKKTIKKSFMYLKEMQRKCVFFMINFFTYGVWFTVTKNQYVRKGVRNGVSP